MTTKKGTLLEENVYRLFKLAGCNPVKNKIIEGYEIDVFVLLQEIKLIIECKQYEKGTLGVRNLLHQWDSKRKIIKPTHILIVTVGSHISQADYKLARKFKIAIWDDEKLLHLLDKAISKKYRIKDEVLKEAGIYHYDPIKGNEKYRERKILSIIKEYYCTREQAEKYVTGKIKKVDIINIKQTYLQIIEDNLSWLTNVDVYFLKHNNTYHGAPFRDIINTMIKYNVQDKNIGLMLLTGKPATYSGKYYNETDIKIMILLMDELGYTFDQVNKVGFNKYTVKQVRDKIYQLKSNNITIFNEKDWYLVETIKNTEQDVSKGEVNISKIFAVLGTIIAIFVLSVLIFSFDVVVEAILTIIIFVIIFFYIVLKFTR